MKIFRNTSLRSRYAFVAAFLMGAIAVAMVVANNYVSRLRDETTGRIGERNQMLVDGRQIRDATWQTRELLSAFLLDPYRGEQRTPIRVEMERARSSLARLDQLVRKAIPSHQSTVEMIRDNIESLDRSLDTIIATRLNATAQYPSMAIAENSMFPLYRDFSTAVSLAIDETDASDGVHLKSETYLNLIESRQLWTQLISAFRIYLANRMGSFREDTLLSQEHEVVELYNRLSVKLRRLNELRLSAAIGIQTEDSIATMTAAAQQWMIVFRQVLQLHSTDAWRADAKLLKESIEPKYHKIWNGLISIDTAIEERSDSDVIVLNDATNTQKYIFWSVTAVCMLAIIGGFFAMERAILRPLLRLSRALKAEANDESIELRAGDGIEETQDLLRAFDHLRTQVHARRRDLEHQALHDALTGLPNRAHLERSLRTSIKQAEAAQEPLALLLVDLDRLKEVNDTLGHDIGDQLLSAISKNLVAATTDCECVARFGGDEFGVLIRGADEYTARGIAREIIQSLEQSFEIDNHKLLVGASVGIALYPRDGDTPQVLLRHADVAMYDAKQKRTGCATYDPDSDKHSARRLALVRELRDAIDNNGLELHFQPKLALADMDFIGVEALLRWTHPEHGRIPPDQAVAIAEQTGLIRPLTRWVLNAALEQCARWRQDGLEIRVAVNLSAGCIADPYLTHWIETWFSKHDLSPSQLILEVTESAMMTDPSKAAEALEKFAQMTIGVSVDDYGTGFSSLAYLKRLPINELKIDRSFVMDMLTNENDTVIVKSTIDLAHNLGLKVVAEGIENQDTLDLLKRLGCDCAQGYHIARPMPARDISTWWLSTLRARMAADTTEANPVRDDQSSTHIVNR